MSNEPYDDDCRDMPEEPGGFCCGCGLPYSVCVCKIETGPAIVIKSSKAEEDPLTNDPLFALGYNEGLEYAAKWITSVLGGYSADVVQFATNNAMSIRVAKRPVQQQDFFDALKNDPEMYSRLQQRAEDAEEQVKNLSRELTIAFGGIRELQAQLAETPEEQREMAESAWLAGMDGTWYAKLQEAQKLVADLRGALRQIVHLPGHNIHLTIRERLDSVVEIAKEALEKGGQDWSSARETLKRLPVINDPIISQAMKDLESDD